MTITHIETEFSHGVDPINPLASDIALEAGVSELTAQAMLSASWAQVEAWTNKTYRTTTTGEVIIRVSSPMVWTWPRYPFPPALVVQCLVGKDWQPWKETYIPYIGLIELEPFSTYRLSHTEPVPGAPVTPAVEQAVTNLTLYQLIQSPTRREFQTQNAGDSGLTRERLLTVFMGSGAGALLAGEVRL